MPSVKSKENLQCSVCLDDFEISAEAGEMPCKHKFHSGCILPWLELHSSCPVRMFQIAADESKLDSDASQNVSSNNGHGSSEGGVSSEKGLKNPELLNWPENGDDPCCIPRWDHVFCSGSRVSQIQVQNLGLKGPLPQNLNQLSMLTSLGLQGNNSAVNCHHSAAYRNCVAKFSSAEEFDSNAVRF
ncbi:hypothetical protein VitviT2T_026368 [Vitis vinifera]|uniref:RING-type E3 ubiquitin transferase n=1 Tax=Vitis vinifera TaxID=29760 RepID=A0ABY9DMU2_VITVI|nr:hypothetical protein VitviT2T_026368 [Vitis vinifera]